MSSSNNSNNSKDNRTATTVGYFDKDSSTTTSKSKTAATAATATGGVVGVGVGGKESLTAEQKQRLDEIMSYMNSTSNDSSKFIKFAPNQTKILKVITEKTELVDVKFPSDPNNVVKRCRFTVYEMVADEVGGQLKPSGETKEFTTSMSLAKNIIQLNQKGFTTLEILRTGEGLTTRWVVTPVV